MIYHEQIRKSRQIFPETGSTEGYHPRYTLSSDYSHSIHRHFRNENGGPKRKPGLWTTIEMKN